MDKKNNTKNNSSSLSGSDIKETWDQLKEEFENILKNKNYSDIYNSNPLFNKVKTASESKNSNNEQESDTSENQNSQANNLENFASVQKKIFGAFCNAAGNSTESEKTSAEDYDKNSADSWGDLLSIFSNLKGKEAGETPNVDALLSNFFSIPTSKFLPFDDEQLKKMEDTFINHHIGLSFERLGLNLQKQTQEGLKSLGEFYHHYNILLTILYNTVPKAITIFDDKISEQFSDDEEILFSITDVYELWIDSCEAAYLQVTGTDAFSVAYGNIINNFINLKNKTSEFSNNISSTFGLPTQAEVDEAQRGQHQLEEQHASIKEDLCNVLHKQKIDESVTQSKMNALTDEIEQLKEQIESLKKLIQNPQEPEKSKDTKPSKPPGTMH